MKKTVLITGASSGFGKLAAKTFHEKGWNVIATMRSPEKETELTELESLLVTRLDVTDNTSVRNAVAEGVEKFGTIDVLVNNAGYGGHALFEQFTDEAIRAMYETNVFGVMNVSREVLPVMRKQKDGTIINITSAVGYIGPPATSIYTSTKHAIEGLTESMALEYKPLNIKIKAIAPGAFGTNFIASTFNEDASRGDEEVKSHTQKILTHFEALVGQMMQQGGKEANPQDVADLIYRCATEEMPVHNIVGADAEMIVGMKNSMPHQDFLEKLEEMVMPKM